MKSFYCALLLNTFLLTASHAFQIYVVSDAVGVEAKQPATKGAQTIKNKIPAINPEKEDSMEVLAIALGARDYKPIVQQEPILRPGSTTATQTVDKEPKEGNLLFRMLNVISNGLSVSF